MTDHKATFAALVDAAAVALDLEIRPEWRDAVVFSLRTALEHARRIEAHPLPDTGEPAPVFDAFETGGA